MLIFDRMVVIGGVAARVRAVATLVVVLGSCGDVGSGPASGRGTSASPDAGTAGIAAGAGTTTVRPPSGSAAGGGFSVVQVDATPVRDGKVSVVATLGGSRGASSPSMAAEVVAPSEPARPASTQEVATTPDGGAQRIALSWNARADLGMRWVGPVTLRVKVSSADQAAPPVDVALELDNLRAAARQADHYLVNYGLWSSASVELAKRYQLVITHPAKGNISRDQVQAIQGGIDPADPADDVLVLCYVSVGEDMRTPALANDQLRSDPRLRGDGSGPRVDPRGPGADGSSLAGIDPRGSPSRGGSGFASYYLDDNDVHNSPNHVGDGLPDRNRVFGSAFVNAGDPAWFPIVDEMTLDGPDHLSGLREVLTTSHGRGLGCDGVFLDTIDTAAPNSYTDWSSPNQSEFEWTAPGFTEFIRHVHRQYPDKLILQNRGLFFFDPRRPHFRWNARGAVDLVMFESFRLNSNSYEEWNPEHYADNRYQVAPKLMAEASRPDGFRVLSLGYAEGPPDRMSPLTLTGQSTLGSDSLQEDIRVTQDLNGFRHYLSNADVTLANDFVRGHASLDDHTPPRWSSSYNPETGSPASEPTARIGLQRAEAAAGGSITVRWDVALDLNHVQYVLYAQPTPFDFSGAPSLPEAKRIPLVASMPASYLDGVGTDRFPYEATVSGFPAGQKQYLLLRAVDDSPSANQDDNQVVLTVTP